MICYRDMTFFSAACRNETCERRLTDRVKANAQAWWERTFPQSQIGAPIAMADFSSTCPDFQSVEQPEPAAA